MEIRKIKENDLPLLAALNTEIFGDTTKTQALKVFREAWKKRVDGACLVAEENGKIIGAVIAVKILTFYPKAATVNTIFVRKEYRKRGVGNSLMEKCLEGLKKKGITNISLTVDMKNKNAIPLYEKHGFKPFRMLYLKKL